MLIKCFLLGSIADECFPGCRKKFNQEEAGRGQASSGLEISAGQLLSA